MSRPLFVQENGVRRSNPVVLLLLIILFCLVLKVRYNDRFFFTNVDGGLYTDIAEHVRDGHGIVTDVSPYHHGYTYFPHPTAIYPLWPLLYGYVARLVPIQITGIWLPTLCYFGALIFAYLWAGTLNGIPESIWLSCGGERSAPLPSDSKHSLKGPFGIPRRLANRIFPDINPGHILVLFLGLNIKFFEYTSLPYTEGLAYTLFFACLWRFHKIGESTTWTSAIEMGAWLGALMLVRSQFLVVVLSTLIACVWTSYHSRYSQAWPKLLLTGAAFFGVMMPWYLHISRFIPHNRIMSLFRYDQARANDFLSPFHAIAATNSAEEFLRDRAAGLLNAFSPSYKWGYSQTFHALPYVFLLAIILLISLRIYSRKMRFPKALIKERFCGFELVFLGLLSAGSFASMHFMHVDFRQEWLFNHRHALILLIPFFLAWLFISRSRRIVWRIAAAFVAVYTIAFSFMDCWHAANAGEGFFTAQQTKNLSQWLLRQGYGRAPSIAVATSSLPQLLAPQVPNVGFHGVYTCTTQKDLRTLFENLKAEILIIKDSDIGERPLFRDFDRNWFDNYFELKAKGPGFSIFVKRRDQGFRKNTVMPNEHPVS